MLRSTRSYAVWKYPFFIDDAFTVEMPVGSRILHVEVQDDRPCMWVLVDVDAPTIHRMFHVYSTGRKFSKPLPYVATFMTLDGEYVWHLFEDVA